MIMKIFKENSQKNHQKTYLTSTSEKSIFSLFTKNLIFLGALPSGPVTWKLWIFTFCLNLININNCSSASLSKYIFFLFDLLLENNKLIVWSLFWFKHPILLISINGNKSL